MGEPNDEWVRVGIEILYIMEKLKSEDHILTKEEVREMKKYINDLIRKGIAKWANERHTQVYVQKRYYKILDTLYEFARERGLLKP